MNCFFLLLPVTVVLAACPPESSSCSNGPDDQETSGDAGAPQDAGPTNSGAASVATVGGCPAYGFYDGCNYCTATGCTARACVDENGDPATLEPNCQVIYYALPEPDEGQWVCGDDGYVFSSSCVPATP